MWLRIWRDCPMSALGQQQTLLTSVCTNLRGAGHLLSKNPFRGLANGRIALSLHYIVVSCSRH